jgi:hypothetical protein
MQIRKALFPPAECLSLFLGASMRENSISPHVDGIIFSNPSWFSVALFINVCYAINIGFAWSYSVELFLPPFFIHHFDHAITGRFERSALTIYLVSYAVLFQK